jgi:hypothetical protein
LGVITGPPELAEHIESMDFVLGTGFVNRASCTLLTFNNVATFTVSKNTADPTFEESMHKLLIEDGIKIKTERSPLYG